MESREREEYLLILAAFKEMIQTFDNSTHCLEHFTDMVIYRASALVDRVLEGLGIDFERALELLQAKNISLTQREEMEVAFPAVFIHFVNVSYLVQQQRIGEGRATMRVRFILNTLNNNDEDMECLPFEIFQRINIAIQDAKEYEEALNKRCNLTYFDMPTTANMLQAYWIDYEVWFRESSAFKYRNWVERYLVMPPFTNHSDQEPENNEDNHSDHDEPTYDEASDIEDTDET